MSLINDALKRARHAQKRSVIVPDGAAAVTALPPLQPVEDIAREKPQRLLVAIPVLVLSLVACVWLLLKWRNAATNGFESNSPHRTVAVQSAPPAPTNALTVATATMTKWQELQGSDSVASVKASVAPLEDNRTEARESEVPVTSGSENPANSSSTIQISSGTSSAKPGGETPRSAITDGGTPAHPKSAPIDSTPAPNTVDPSIRNASSPTASPPAPVVTSPSNQPSTVQTSQPEPKLQGIFYRIKRPTALIDGRVLSIGDDINGYRLVRIDRDNVKLTAAGRTNTLFLR